MKIIGIDLGTTNTYLYVARDKAAQPRPVVIPRVSEADGCIETAVLYEDGAPSLIGSLAESEYYSSGASQVRRSLKSQFKPEIGQDNPQAARWMTDFLKTLRQSLPQGILEPDSRIYAGIPSRTREDFGLSLAQCFAEGGWPRPALIRESDAAMISCLQSGAIELDDLENKLLIMDFGGGTCDFTLAENTDVLRSGGDRLFGGRLFDDLLFQAFCRSNSWLEGELAADNCAYYVHWILCKAEKERFSEALKRDPDGSISLHVSWYDAQGRQKHAYVHDYGREQFVRDAENYAASDFLLAMLKQYADRGDLSPRARDMLEGRRIGLISWFKDILYDIDGHKSVAKVILTGGSSRWFFAREAVREVMGIENIVVSGRAYEDIAYGLALYPTLLDVHLKIKNLLAEQSEDFSQEAGDVAQNIFEKHTKLAARACAERIAARDIMAVLEAAQQSKKTVEEIEKQIAEKIRNDTGLLAIIKERTEAASAEIERELRQRFSRWLRENGVFLAPRLDFSARTLSQSFFDAVRVKVSRLTLLNTMDMVATAVLPGVAAYAVGEKMLLTTGEPVSAVLGGAAAFAGIWALGKFGKNFLRQRKLSGFLLNEKNRQKIIAKNKEYIEEALNSAFLEIRGELMEDARSKIRYALKALLQKLTVLNHIRVERTRG